MYAFLLVKNNESHVTLSNAFQHLEAISPTSTQSGGWIPLDLTYGDRNFLVLKIPGFAMYSLISDN
jgi:hypothetical protein